MSATSRQVIAAKTFLGLGYSPEGAAALVGNFSQEVGPNLPTAFRQPPTKFEQGSQGMPQWRLNRLTDYEKFVAGLHPGASTQTLWAEFGNLANQAAYVDQELRTSYPALYIELRKKNTGDLDTVTANLTTSICWTYERPSAKYADLNKRISYALDTHKAISNDTAVISPTSASASLVQQSKRHTDAATTAKTVAAGAVIAGAINVPSVAHTVLHHGNPWVAAAWIGGFIVAGLVALLYASTSSSNASAAATAAATVVKSTASTPATPVK